MNDLQLYMTVSKKAIGSSNLTIESLKEELQEGIVFIFGGITDAFGAAQDEMIIVMRYIDKQAVELSLLNKTLLLRQSIVIPGLVYDYGGTFREACTRTCQMHNFERVLVSLLDVLMGNQGLTHEMTSAQNLYRLNYYWVKFKAMVNALTTVSVGGDPTLYMTAPKEMRKLIGKVARTRWLSAERTTERLIELLKVQATTTMIKFVKDYFGGDESNNWKAACKYCTCIGSNYLSQFMLTFWYIANHTPGGRKGEGMVGCMKVLGFLGSPYHRVSIHIVASLYPIHLKWVKFSDRVSEIGVEAKAISTRAIENVLFERHFISDIYRLTSNWKTFLPESYSFLQSEALRSKALGFDTDEKDMEEYYDCKIKEGTKSMLEMTLKYFLYPGLKLGWSILQVVDPYVGPKAAFAILSALKSLYSADHDFTSLEVDLLEEEYTGPVLESWRTDSETHCAPGIDMRSYQNMIVDGYINSTRPVVDSIVKAYGLLNEVIISELVMIARGGLKNALIQHNDWPPKNELKSYWSTFKASFPGLEESLTFNFQSRPITGTAAEQSFSLAATQVRANNSASTNSKNMRHASDIKGAIIRDMKDFRAAHIEGEKKKKILRDKDTKHEYLSRIVSHASCLTIQASTGGVLSVPTKSIMRKHGKNISELIEALPHTHDEMTANAKSVTMMADGDALQKAVMDFTNTKKEGLDNMPEEVKDHLVESAKKMYAKDIKILLKSYYPNDDTKHKFIDKLNKGEISNENCLVTVLVTYWRNNNILP